MTKLMHAHLFSELVHNKTITHNLWIENIDKQIEGNIFQKLYEHTRHTN